MLVLALALSMLSAGQSRAHPYLFIDVEAALVFDAPGRLTAIRASLSMNETDSLYIASEYGLDPDGPLTPEQSKFLFDLYAKQFAKWSWVTFIEVDGAFLEMAPPKVGSARMKDAVLTLLQFFEPTFYAEAIVKAAPTIEGSGGERCELTFTPYQSTAETKRLRLALSLVPPDVTPDDPMAGRAFADRTEVRCGDV